MASASEFTLGTDNARMGSRVFITIRRSDSACLQELTMFVGETVITRAEVSASSYVWQVPDCSELCPGHPSALCQVECKTWLRGEYLGSRRANIFLTLPDPVKLEARQMILGTPTELRGSKAAKGFTMDYFLLLAGESIPIAEKTTQGELTWTPGYELAKKFPRLVKTGADLRAVTWNGSYQVGFRDTAVTLEAPDVEELRPVITGLTLEPLVKGLPDAFMGLYIRGKTGLRASHQVRWEYANPGTVVLTLGARELGDGQLELLDRSGPQTVTATATDSRGFVGKLTREITVLPYEKPRVLPYGTGAQVICQRADETGQLTPAGTYLALRAGRRAASIPKDGMELNRSILRYRIRKTQDPAFPPWVTLLTEDSKENQVSLLMSGLVEDTMATYQVELSVLDTLGGEHRMAFSVLTQAVSFALYDGVDGAAFGKYPEEEHVVDLAPHMTLRVRGRLQVLGEQWQELGLSSQVESSAYPVGRQEDTGCFIRVCQGSRAVISFNCSGSFQPGGLTVNRDPVPPELLPRRKVTAVCLREGGTMAVTLDPQGFVKAESLSGPGYAGWMDGCLEYFL